MLDLANIKRYQCENWPEGPTHGGGRGTTEIIDATLENIFDHIQPEEAQAGDTEYRKIYIRNQNADTWPDVKVWISQFTPWTEDEIWINVGDATWTDTQADAFSYTFYQPDSKSHADAHHPNVYDDAGVLQNNFGNVGENQCFPIWLKRVVNPTTQGYTNNSAKIACGSSP